MGRFQGLTVLVTGATGGIGRRVAERLAAEGARLVLSDIEIGPLEDLANSLGTDSATLAGDIADEEVSESLVRLAVRAFRKARHCFEQCRGCPEFPEASQRTVRRGAPDHRNRSARGILRPEAPDPGNGEASTRQTAREARSSTSHRSQALPGRRGSRSIRPPSTGSLGSRARQRPNMHRKESA